MSLSNGLRRFSLLNHAVDLHGESSVKIGFVFGAKSKKGRRSAISSRLISDLQAAHIDPNTEEMRQVKMIMTSCT